MLIVVAGEPSPPKLESNLQPKGNSVKVNLIKQDDGGSPITHYLIRYKAVSVITHILWHYNVYITTSFNLLLYLNKKTDPAFECPFCPFYMKMQVLISYGNWNKVKKLITNIFNIFFIYSLLFPLISALNLTLLNPFLLGLRRLTMLKHNSWMKLFSEKTKVSVHF